MRFAGYCVVALSALRATLVATAAEPLPPANVRFAKATEETPDFRRHVSPLLGRLGCNGRACHGSFQGQGGFRLSLFGYDYAADHRSFLEGDEPRVNLQNPSESLMLFKPTHADEHGGGQRMETGTWPYELIRQWIEGGAAGSQYGGSRLMRLEVAPREVVLSQDGERLPLRVLAHWSDGSTEDVTPLCRYQTNDESIAEVDADGIVTSRSRGDTHIIAFYDETGAVAQVLRPVASQWGADAPQTPAPTQIDQLVLTKLRKLGIVPSEVCSDAEFLRRVSLDLTGTLPTPAEIEAFLADDASDKRVRKIDELLERPSYVARWTTKLCEITGNSPHQFQDKGPPAEYARQWYEWIARRVRDNSSYDQIVEGIVFGRSRQPGVSYDDFIAAQSAYFREQEPSDFTARENMPYYWAKQTSRTPEERALNFSYAFLGVRIECAQCHKHPFDRWTQDDFNGFTAFFDRIGFGVAPDGKKVYQQLIDELGDKGNQAQRERARLIRAQHGEIVPWNEVFVSDVGTRVENGRVVKAIGRPTPRVLGGEPIDLPPNDDPRKVLMDWMRQKDNPYFARVFINRVWAEYFGRGIIDPPDDMNLANPPSNAPLLDFLADGFIEHDFDMKWLHREIANSETYQRSLATNETNRLDERNFSHAVARRLPAEVLFDAIEQATANTNRMERTAFDVEERAIGPKGGALVGRRDFGDYASTVFGRSPRTTNCDCSASDEANLLQAIYMQNDREVLTAIERKDGWLQEVRSEIKSSRDTIDIPTLVDDAFLRSLSRLPAESERLRAVAHVENLDDPVLGLSDLMWALLNTREFVTNH